MLPQLLSNIRASESYGCEQPSLPFALASELMIDFSVQRLNTYDCTMNDLEEMMGQHEYNDRPRGNPLELDFVGTTRRINHVTKRLAVDVCMLESMLLALERIEEWKRELEKQRRNDNELSPAYSAPEEIDKGSSIVDEKIAYLKDTCHLQVSGAKFQEKRISALIQVVRLSSHIIVHTLIRCLMRTRSTNSWRKRTHSSTSSYPKPRRHLLKQARKTAR